VKLDNSNEFEIFAIGWRATGKVVCTYVHTCSTNKKGTDRKKEKEQLLSTGKVKVLTCHVMRPVGGVIRAPEHDGGNRHAQLLPPEPPPCPPL
jgi:hypothetical protein